MLSYVISGAVGGVVVLVVQATVLYLALKKEAQLKAEKKALMLDEYKKFEEELNEALKRKEENLFNKGDFLKSKEFPRQPWETVEPPTIEAEVLDVGNGAYLLDVRLPGYQGRQATIPFLEAHSAFEKDTTKRAKPKLTVIKDVQEVQ